MKYALFTREEKGKTILLCLISPEEEPDKVEKDGDLALLYKEGRLIGFNYFAFDGKDPFSTANKLLESHGLPLLRKEDDARLTEQKKIVSVAEHPLDEKLFIVELEGGLSVVTDIRGLVKGAEVTYLPIGGIAPDGRLSKKEKVRNVDSEGLILN